VSRAFGTAYEKGGSLVSRWRSWAGGGGGGEGTIWVAHGRASGDGGARTRRTPQPTPSRRVPGRFWRSGDAFGVYVVKDEQVRWMPAINANLVIVVAFLTLRMIARARRRAHLTPRDLAGETRPQSLTICAALMIGRWRRSSETSRHESTVAKRQWFARALRLRRSAYDLAGLAHHGNRRGWRSRCLGWCSEGRPARFSWWASLVSYLALAFSLGGTKRQLSLIVARAARRRPELENGAAKVFVPPEIYGTQTARNRRRNHFRSGNLRHRGGRRVE